MVMAILVVGLAFTGWQYLDAQVRWQQRLIAALVAQIERAAADVPTGAYTPLLNRST